MVSDLAIRCINEQGVLTPDAGVVLVPLKDDVRVGHELGDVTSGRVLLVGDLAVPAGAELPEGLACFATTHDTGVLAEQVVNAFALGNGACVGVALGRATSAAHGLPEDGAHVSTFAFGDDLNVVSCVVVSDCCQGNNDLVVDLPCKCIG